MPSSWDFIIEGITFSYSSLSSFRTCPYGFKLAYIDMSERVDNFYSDFGKLIHSTFEQYFDNKLQSFELSQYYSQHYSNVTNTLPVYQSDVERKYWQQGKEFFDNFSFDLNRYSVLHVETSLRFNLLGTKFVAKPDLVLFNKEDGSIELFDYKSSTPYVKRGERMVPEKKKFEDYYKQMYLYAYALRVVGELKVNKISLWFPRLNNIVTVDYDMEKESETLEWVAETLELIRNEEEFPYNNKQPYFCNNLCSVRHLCPFKK